MKYLFLLLFISSVCFAQNKPKLLDPDSEWRNSRSNELGYQTNSEFALEVSRGNVDGYSFIEKFGENPDVNTGTDPEDLWSFGGVYIFSTTDDIDRLSSSNDSDTEDITITGLDTNWAEVIQTITLTGQTPVALTTNLIRVYRMFNANGADLLGVVYCFVDTSVDAGVPDDDANVRAIISIGAGQTEMCVYTIPAGKTGYFYGGYVSLSRVGLNSNAVFTSRIRAFGGVFRVVSRIACVAAGNSSWQYKYPFPLAIPEKTDIVLRCDEVGSNSTGVSGGFTIQLIDN